MPPGPCRSVVNLRSQFVASTGRRVGPYTRAALYSSASLSHSGMPITRAPPGLVTHHARATSRISPQGLSGSPYRPRPECSKDEYVTTASKAPSSPPWYRLAYSAGWIACTCGWSVVIFAYSSVTTSFAPAARTDASTHGTIEPITSTQPLGTLGVFEVRSERHWCWGLRNCRLMYLPWLRTPIRRSTLPATHGPCRHHADA